MTLLEYCKAIPVWREFIEVEKSESGQPDIYVNLCALNYYYTNGCSSEKEYRIKELGFNYFDAIMCNILPCEYYEYSTKHDEEVWNWSSYWISPSSAKILTDFKIVIDQEVREFYATPYKPCYIAKGKQLVRKKQIEKPGIFNNGIKSTLHLMSLAGKNGNISSQEITLHRLPNTCELINDAMKIIKFYEEVDLVIAFTDLNKTDCTGGYQGFLDHIEIGLWIHNSTIELMESSRARKKYQEYNQKYSIEDKKIYIKKFKAQEATGYD